jgi:Skp family chaperone for outer membrane proteins
MAVSKKRKKQKQKMSKPSKSKQQSQKKNKEFNRLFNKHKQLLKNPLLDLKQTEIVAHFDKLERAFNKPEVTLSKKIKMVKDLNEILLISIEVHKQNK